MICRSDDGTLLFSESTPTENARGSLLVIHGLGEHLGRYEELAAFAKKMKLDVHRIDLRGHGRSNGIRGHVNLFSEYHKDLDAWIHHLEGSGELRKGLPCFIFGHSLGGLIALTYLAQHKAQPLSVEFSGLILSAPALGLKPSLVSLVEKSVAKRIPKFFRTLQISNGIKAELLTHDKAAVARYRADPLVHPWATPGFFLAINRAIRVLPKTLSRIHVPVLFLLPGKDAVINTVAAEQYAAKLAISRPGTVTVKKFHSFYHEVLHESKRARAYLELKKWLQLCLQTQTQSSSKKGSSKSSKRGVIERAPLH